MHYSLAASALAPGQDPVLWCKQHHTLVSWFIQPGHFEKVLIATIVLFHFILTTWDIHPSADSFFKSLQYLNCHAQRII